MQAMDALTWTGLGRGAGAGGGGSSDVHASGRAKGSTRERVPASTVFLNYRRSDSAGFAGRLTEHLRRLFPDIQVLRDVEAMPSGSDLAVELDRRLKASQVMLTLIGPHWLSEAGPNGRCIDDAADPVRRELAAAFARKMLVIPVLVGGAAMPPAAELPTELAPLSGIHAHELTEERWDYDVQQLADRLFELPLFDLERKLDAIDRQWELERKQYLITDKEGHTREPAPRHTGAIIFVSLFALIWMALTSAIHEPLRDTGGFAGFLAALLFSLAGPAMAALMIALMIGERRKYQRFRSAQDAYQSRRAMLLSRP